MAENWQILVVDDEEDVHDVSRLALRRRTWKNRSFDVHSAMSAAEARQILSGPNCPSFHVALLDVVMESTHAGLELCDFIRERMPASVRIILRTGQPGRAPEEEVMDRYDIDQYLTKGEVQAQRLYDSVRTGCRMSLDISISLALEAQLHQLTDALQVPSTDDRALLAIMSQSLSFLERRHDVALGFIANIDSPEAAEILVTGPGGAQAAHDFSAMCTAIQAAHAQQTNELVFIEGLGELAVLPVKTLESTLPPQAKPGLSHRLLGVLGVAPKVATRPPVVKAGYYVSMDTGRSLTVKEKKDLSHDLSQFAANWRLAYGILHLRETVVRSRVMAMDAQRIAGLSGG